MIPSSAATTRTAISVDFAPLARISVNASCPGVSKKTTFLSLTCTVYAPIDCVIPPTSVATILCFEALILSNNVVLPWSTCPIILTTGALCFNNFLSTFSNAFFFSSFLSSSSIKASISSSKTSSSNSAQTFLIVSTSISWFTVAIIPCIIRNFTISAGVFLILSDNSLMVIASLTTTCVISSMSSSFAVLFL